MNAKKSQLGLWMAPICRIMGVLLLLVNTLHWWHPALTLFVAETYSGLGLSSVILTPGNRLLGWLISSLQISILTYSLFIIADVFQDFGKGEWFVLRFGNKLKKFGISLLVFSLLSPVFQALMGIALTYASPVAQRMFAITLEIDFKGVVILLVGILLILIGRVMTEASRLADDNRQII